MAQTVESLHEAVQSLVERWKPQRAERLARRALDPRDFDELREAGFLRAIVPETSGGLWHDATSSARGVCELLRSVARADPSVALVAAMHPSVLAFWLFNPDPNQPDWERQRQEVFASAAAGEQWGTITSEPGSGGDIARTKATAVAIDDAPFIAGRSYAITGDKHFGSGSGITDRMVTTAIPDGEDGPTIFAIDVRDRPWDGSAGLTLTAEWDGVGMAATQSHAMKLTGVPGVRLAREGPLSEVSAGAGAFVATTFTAVILGVVDEAIAVARQQLLPRAESLRAYERVEWTRAATDHWLAVQAYDGALRAIERGDPLASFAALSAKESIAELAEATLARLSKVIGGGAFSRRSPFAHWNDDVRALGFLRPPWGLAFDTLFTLSWA